MNGEMFRFTHIDIHASLSTHLLSNSNILMQWFCKHYFWMRFFWGTCQQLFLMFLMFPAAWKFIGLINSFLSLPCTLNRVLRDLFHQILRFLYLYRAKSFLSSFATKGRSSKTFLFIVGYWLRSGICFKYFYQNLLCLCLCASCY